MRSNEVQKTKRLGHLFILEAYSMAKLKTSIKSKVANKRKIYPQSKHKSINMQALKEIRSGCI